ncbi:MAG: type II toxin-antitoxin system VapC family toxin [Gemmatimonadota bacterium]
MYIWRERELLEITADTSAIMAVILNEPSKPKLLEQTRDSELLSAPTLPWEIGNSLTALFKRARIDLEQAKGALNSFRDIPVRLAEIDLEASVKLAKEQDIYAYDAYMLEVARKYRTPLLSLDGPQRQVAIKLGIEVLEV